MGYMALLRMEFKASLTYYIHTLYKDARKQTIAWGAAAAHKLPAIRYRKFSSMITGYRADYRVFLI